MNFELFIYYGNWIWKSKVRSATFFFPQTKCTSVPYWSNSFSVSKEKEMKTNHFVILIWIVLCKKRRKNTKKENGEVFWQWLCPLYLLLSIKFSNSPSAVLVPFQCWVFVLFSERYFFKKMRVKTRKKDTYWRITISV